MEALFGVAEKIATPLSLAALVVLVLFYLFKIMFERLNLAQVLGPQVYRLLMRSITYVFVLAVIALVLGLSSYVLVLYMNGIRKEKVELYLRELQDASVLTRSEAIKSLSAVAEEFPDSASAICDSLAFFVRNRSVETLQVSSRRLADDIQTAMVAIGRLNGGGRCKEVDLRGSDLRRLQMPRAKLAGTDLTRARLGQANLSEADLSKARLIGADLTEAVLRKAILKGASLQEALWRETDLTEADLSFSAGLAGGDLMSAFMERAIFDGADLTRTKLPTRPLTKASFKGADLRDTDLRSVIGLCKNDLAAAITGPSTKWPTNGC